MAERKGDKWRERFSWQGVYPCKPEEKKPVVITEDKKISLIHGVEKKGLVEIFVSSDKIHFGIFYVSPFDHLDPSAPHEGDEVYYILEGEGVVLIEDKDVYAVKEGDAFYLPEGLKHQWFNFSGKRLAVLWALAPKL
ncbi:cupin domain-containing protein [Candidatus Poribacteria bacterium]|nr:cupin domain-containing protein [Candidatus Poribacteria bacterium]